MAVCLVVGSFYATVAIGQESDVQQYSEAGQKALAIGDYSAAERAYEKLRDLEPEIAEVHANLGLIYFEQGKSDEAIPEFQRALKLKPSLAKTEILLAMSLSEVNRYREALPGLEKGFRGLCRSGNEAHVWLATLTHLYRTPSRQQCGRGGTGTESSLSE